MDVLKNMEVSVSRPGLRKVSQSLFENRASCGSSLENCGFLLVFEAFVAVVLMIIQIMLLHANPCLPHPTLPPILY